MPETAQKQAPLQAPMQAPNQTPGIYAVVKTTVSGNFAGNSDSADQTASNAASALRPLRRLHQLAGEIQAALGRGDMDVMSRASALLAPALEQWAMARPGADADNVMALQLTRETQQALLDCEQAVSQAMLPVRARYNATMQHKSRIRQMRLQKQARTKNLRPSRLLDIRH